MTELQALVAEILSRSASFEPPFVRNGREALQLLGTLAASADASFPKTASPAAPTRPSAPVLPKQRAPIAASTQNPEYKPALQDPTVVDALLQLHAQAYQSIHGSPQPVAAQQPSFRPARLPEVAAKPKLPPLRT